jgi:hypothetical protein
MTYLGEIGIRYQLMCGFLDVQRLTCAPLAGTFQEDADMLSQLGIAAGTMAWPKNIYSIRPGRKVLSTR